MQEIIRINDERIDELEAAIAELPPVECPLKHRFTPGLYIREIFMPAGSLITSKIHNTCHPYVVSKGSVSVRIDEGNWQLIEAPFTGITNPGTRRVLYIHTDCVWVTFHPIPEITGEENEWSEEEKKYIVGLIEERIIDKHENLLIKKEEPCLGFQLEAPPYQVSSPL